MSFSQASKISPSQSECNILSLTSSNSSTCSIISSDKLSNETPADSMFVETSVSFHDIKSLYLLSFSIFFLNQSLFSIASSKLENQSGLTEYFSFAIDIIISSFLQIK